MDLKNSPIKLPVLAIHVILYVIPASTVPTTAQVVFLELIGLDGPAIPHYAQLNTSSTLMVQIAQNAAPSAVYVKANPLIVQSAPYLVNLKPIFKIQLLFMATVHLLVQLAFTHKHLIQQDLIFAYLVM